MNFGLSGQSVEFYFKNVYRAELILLSPNKGVANLFMFQRLDGNNVTLLRTYIMF